MQDHTGNNLVAELLPTKPAFCQDVTVFLTVNSTVLFNTSTLFTRFHDAFKLLFGGGFDNINWGYPRTNLDYNFQMCAAPHSQVY